MTLIGLGSPESLVKSPVIFSLCTWTLRCRTMPDDAGVRNRLFSETSDFDRKSGTPLSGPGGPIPGDRASDSCHSVMCTSPPGHGGLGDEDCAVCTSAIALCRTGSDEPINRVICAPVAGVSPYWTDIRISESSVTLRRSGSARTVNDVIRTVDPGGNDVSSLYVHPVLCDWFTIMMIIVTLLQSVLSRSLRWKFAPGSLYGSLCREVCTGSLHREFVPGVVPGLPVAPVL